MFSHKWIPACGIMPEIWNETMNIRCNLLLTPRRSLNLFAKIIILFCTAFISVVVPGNQFRNQCDYLLSSLRVRFIFQLLYQTAQLVYWHYIDLLHCGLSVSACVSFKWNQRTLVLWFAAEKIHPSGFYHQLHYIYWKEIGPVRIFFMIVKRNKPN